MLRSVIALALVAASSSCSLLQPKNDSYAMLAQWSMEAGLGSENQQLELQPAALAQTESGDYLYIVANDGELQALQRTSGTEVWSVKLPFRISSGLVVTENSLFVGRDNGVAAVDRSSGAISWLQKQLSGEVITAVTVHDDKILVRTTSGYLYALARNSGKIIWQYQWNMPSLTVRGESAVVVSGNLAVVGTASGKVIAVQIEDGVPVWEINYANAKGRNDIERLSDVDFVATMQDLLIVSADRHGTAALDSSTGNIVWRRDQSTSKAVAVDARSVYVSDEDGVIHAFSLDSGASLWRNETLRKRFHSITVAEQGVFVSDYDGYLYWLNSETGATLASYRVGRVDERFPVATELSGFNQSYAIKRALLTKPVIVANMLYAMDQRGVINAVLLQEPNR